MTKSNFCESHLEEAVLEWFEELGYEIVFAPDISPDGKYPEREDYIDVILNERLNRNFLFLGIGAPLLEVV